MKSDPFVDMHPWVESRLYTAFGAAARGLCVKNDPNHMRDSGRKARVVDRIVAFILGTNSALVIELEEWGAPRK